MKDCEERFATVWCEESDWICDCDRGVSERWLCQHVALLTVYLGMKGPYAPVQLSPERKAFYSFIAYGDEAKSSSCFYEDETHDGFEPGAVDEPTQKTFKDLDDRQIFTVLAQRCPEHFTRQRGEQDEQDLGGGEGQEEDSSDEELDDSVSDEEVVEHSGGDRGGESLEGRFDAIVQEKVEKARTAVQTLAVDWMNALDVDANGKEGALRAANAILTIAKHLGAGATEPLALTANMSTISRDLEKEQTSGKRKRSDTDDEGWMRLEVVARAVKKGNRGAFSQRSRRMRTTNTAWSGIHGGSGVGGRMPKGRHVVPKQGFDVYPETAC